MRSPSSAQVSASIEDRALRDLGVRLEPRREVDGVADAGVGGALLRAGVAGDHLAGGDADADADRRACPRAARSALNSSISSIISSAARTAAPAWSASGSGAPKIAIRPSPIIWLTTPPWPLMASNISV